MTTTYHTLREVATVALKSAAFRTGHPGSRPYYEDLSREEATTILEDAGFSHIEITTLVRELVSIGILTSAIAWADDGITPLSYTLMFSCNPTEQDSEDIDAFDGGYYCLAPEEL